MVDKAGYRAYMAASPVTAWTTIAKAGNPGAPENRLSMEELVILYDRPLQVLFEGLDILKGDPEKAKDWKQDFLVSHLLPGTVFKHAKPKARFRTFLAVVVKNYVINRYKKDLADKRNTAEGARAFSQLGDEEDNFESNVTRSVLVQPELGAGPVRLRY
jgi:DNA-directed RNA polymerase specialized sigma24 family protein